jgi:hypothetical protein
MINQNDKNTSDNEENFREIAETHLIEKDGHWMLQGFDNKTSPQSKDLNRSYQTRAEAVDAAVELLRANKLKAA